MSLISVSLLSADFSALSKEVNALEKSRADMLHLDIMDGHFVPNLTFGPDIVKTIRNLSQIDLDVHLMIQNPENWIKIYAEAGASIITIHPESTVHLDRAISLIHDNGCKAGVALLPTTPESVLDYILDQLDLILVMSVNPGFGGQKFMPKQLNKIQSIAAKLKNNDKEILLSVDGGINSETAAACIAAGANMLVSGSYIFSGDYSSKISSLRTT